MPLKSVLLTIAASISVIAMYGCSSSMNDKKSGQEYRRLSKIIAYLSTEEYVMHYDSIRNGRKGEEAVFRVANRDVDPNFDAFPESCLFSSITGTEPAIPGKYGKRPVSDSLSALFSKPYNVSMRADWENLSTSRNAANILFINPLDESHIYCVIMHDRGNNLHYSFKEKYIAYAGLSLSYFFTFSDKGEIEHVCFGETENRSW